MARLGRSQLIKPQLARQFPTTAQAVAISQAAYRFYDEGSESAGSALAAQDTAYTADTSSGNVVVWIRMRLQSTTSTAIQSTDDFQLQYDKNASGTWTNVTTSSSNVFAYSTPNLSEGAATTNRLTGGTGSFTAGKGSGDGQVDNLGWSGNNFTEVVYTVTLKQTDLANNDALTFRTLYNGATTSFTYSKTPTINIAVPAITQAAYRFYSDGTETGSAALAAQDTAYTANVYSGDVNLLLRARLQSTNSNAGASTDDWQLQYEINGNGQWATPGPNGGLFDSALSASTPGYDLDTTTTHLGQSFISKGGDLTRVGFMLLRSGSPVGVLHAKLYAHTGTYGTTSGVPTGSALATSTTTQSAALVSTSSTMYYFDFTPYTMAAGTAYCIVVAYQSTTTINGSNYIGVDYDVVTEHAGRMLHSTNGTTWTAPFSEDAVFAVYNNPYIGYFDSTNLTNGAATTNRLTGGTGTFVAGKISEDSLVDDFNLTVNNYTELLYTVTLKTAYLANSDVVRFRIVYKNVPYYMTYSQTPTLNITKTATATGRPKYYNGSTWQQKPMKIYNGSTWQEKPVKVWTGSVWKTLT